MNYTPDFVTTFSKMTYHEMINLYKQCKLERESSKIFDYDKIFKATVKFYIDKKHYSIEHANEIAQKVVEQQRIAWSKKQ